MAQILVLDDILDAALLTKRILEESGHSVHPFTDEEKALTYVRDNRVDLAILDLRLKKMSGVDVLAQIKKISPETRAIMLTAYPTIEAAGEAMRLGAADFCTKPIDTQELEDKVAVVLRSDG
jgi:DNA-binding NtrC family response regulator